MKSLKAAAFLIATLAFLGGATSTRAVAGGRDTATWSRGYVRLVGNTNSMVFHRAEAKDWQNINNPQNLKGFQDALDQGYRACKRCFPFVGNKESHIYHANGMADEANMKRENKVFMTTQDATDQGYRACKNCFK